MELGYEEPPRAKSDPLAFQKQQAGTALATAGGEWPKMINGVLTQDPSKPTGPVQQYPKWSALFNRSFKDADEEKLFLARAEHEAEERRRTERPPPPAPAPAPPLALKKK
jgi:hypothetical protein